MTESVERVAPTRSLPWNHLIIVHAILSSPRSAATADRTTHVRPNIVTDEYLCDGTMKFTVVLYIAPQCKLFDWTVDT